MPPEDQQRPLDAYARPGQYDWARPDPDTDPDQGSAGAQQQEAAPQGAATPGDGGDGQGGAVWQDWNASRKDP
eukprot:9041295-Heterocapsa_arctica.AAC.1